MVGRSRALALPPACPQDPPSPLCLGEGPSCDWLRQKAEPVLVVATGQTCSCSPRRPRGGGWELCAGISWRGEEPHSRNKIPEGCGRSGQGRPGAGDSWVSWEWACSEAWDGAKENLAAYALVSGFPSPCGPLTFSLLTQLRWSLLAGSGLSLDLGNWRQARSSVTPPNCLGLPTLANNILKHRQERPAQAFKGRQSHPQATPTPESRRAGQKGWGLSLLQVAAASWGWQVGAQAPKPSSALLPTLPCLLHS